MQKKDLENAFGRTFDLSNDNYRACCPFHDERNPSFFIHSTDLIGNCFGCGVSGSVDKLLAQYCGIDIQKAREILGITFEDSLTKFRSKAIRRNSGQEEKVYPESWLAPWKREVHKYVLDRGFHLDVLRRAESRYDSNQQRQVFPVRRHGDGRLLGATGRSCAAQDPKWFHYWDFNTGCTLYTPFNTDPLRPLILVEGVFDLLWLYQNGVDNVAATFGAKLTQRQRGLLLRLCNSVTLGFDNDAAGDQATEKAHRMLSQSIRTTFVKWPTGARDWMDLDRDQIHQAIGHTESYVYRNLVRYSEACSRVSV